jgi:sugar phosphate isomerase/epimerase
MFSVGAEVFMNRRSFLNAIASAAAVSGVMSPQLSHSKECSPLLLNGTQLFSVYDLLNSDAKATLGAVGELGFESVELFGLDSRAARDNNFFGLTPIELLNTLKSSGLAMTHSHIGEIWEDTDTVARIAERLRVEVLILGAAEEFYDMPGGVFNPKPATDIAQLERLAARLNRAGQKYRRHGITFGYHNHWTEFIPVEGTIPLDYLIENTDPDNFKLELDVAWLTVAGIDPVTYIRRHSDRVVSCHLKDFDDRVALPDSPTWAEYIEAAIVEPGSGTIDFEPIINVLAEIDLTHAFVETDKSSNPLAAIERGKRHLKSLDLC